MTIAIVLIFGAVMFAVGYMLGDLNGWDRCWENLTKNDRWRQEANDEQ